MSALTGKTALVTGASRGIGRAIAARLASDGAHVAVHYGHDHAAAENSVATIERAGGRAFAVCAPLGADGDVDALFSALDEQLLVRTGSAHLDIVVNNAGIARPSALRSTTVALYDELFAVNTRGPFFITKAAIERINDGGRIILISTSLTRNADPELLTYTMTKGALDVMTPTLAKELGPRGITVNTVAPGITDTDMNADWLRSSDESFEMAAAASVFNRVGQPGDVADVVAFVASDDARWVTGQYLDAAGGALV